ncbi:short-chain dehydrogenase/reductase SDR [Irpex rosettiformis]|uniref:Short-chain dehydrogenase/reductase SDR n=1 Tax=Irpex rosettiformis TaxID=378272 RepID=A0ACB8U2I3_9APHY|nr:short-chain dehydrogenase/reductase SDR [Irpex rosettiformis]
MSGSDSQVKVIVITGASSGIGRITAITFAKAGWSVVLFARRADRLQETVTECPDPGKTLIVQGDVTDEAAVLRLFASAVERFGHVDVLFNNAGIGHPAVPIDELSLSAWQSVVDVNLTGVFLASREAFKVFKKQSPPGGRIINNGSIAAYSPRLYAVGYTSTKHAVLGLTKALHLEGRQHNIAVSQIDIGNALTDLTATFTNGATQADGSQKPEPTFDAKHVADSILHVAELPLNVTVLTFNIMATTMPFIGRG